MIQPTALREYISVDIGTTPRQKTVVDAAHPWSVVSVLDRHDRKFTPQNVLTYEGRHRR